jgi:metallo-beta-lactamase class B
VHKLFALSLSLMFFTAAASARQVHEPHFRKPEWTRPYEPFRIAGNLYYVGTADLGCYLIVTPAGNILINTGIGSSRKIIQENIEKLGFRVSDIRILLTTQVHYDHVGAMAEMKKLSGAKLMVDAADAPVMEDGGNSDYEYGGKGWLFMPAKVDRRLNNNDTVSLGGTQLVMLHHPGHTKGSCSFMLTVKDQKRPYRVLIANMPTIIVEKGLNEVHTYPGMSADYAYTLRSMKALQFDLWVASHGSQFDLEAKHKPGTAYNPMIFAGRKDYDASLRDLEQAYEKKK